MASPFATILRAAVERTPGAVGGAFAASDGEMVDAFTRRDATEWAILTAHYGVVLSNLEDAFGSLHFGEPEYVVIANARLDVLIQPVAEGYFALLAIEPPASIPDGLRALKVAAADLAREMM